MLIKLSITDSVTTLDGPETETLAFLGASVHNVLQQPAAGMCRGTKTRKSIVKWYGDITLPECEVSSHRDFKGSSPTAASIQTG